MENMMPMLSGGLRKRPGTWYDGTTNGSKKARLIDWLLSDGTALVLELTIGTIRVWQEANDNYEVIQTISSPYSEEQLFDLHYAKTADALWIVHSQQRPIKLEWEGSAVRTSYPSFKKTGDEDDEIDFISENNRPSCVAFESGRLCFAGTNREPNRIYLSRAPDSQTGENRHTDFTTEDIYLDVRETATKVLNEDGSEKTEPVLDADGYPMYGPPKFTFEITNYPYEPITWSYLTYKGIVYRLESYDAYPRNGAWAHADILEMNLQQTYRKLGRIEYTLSWGAVENTERFTISQVEFMEDYEDHDPLEGLEGIYQLKKVKEPVNTAKAGTLGRWFRVGEIITEPVLITRTEITENINITASHAVVLEENDMHGSRIQWLMGNRRLLAATDKTTWCDTGEIPTPATFDMNIIEYVGANRIQPQGSKEATVYVGRDGKSLRALVWDGNSPQGGYVDMDISEQAAHLFTSGIKDFAVMSYPSAMVWIVTNAGELISCTLNLRSGILAYARHKTDGIVEAVAVSSEKTRDVIFLAVRRGEYRNIEHFTLDDLINSDFTDSHYVDAGERRTFSTPTKTITGLQRFAGQTIRAFADGAAEPPVKVSEDGVAELRAEISKIHFGLPYKAAFSPNDRQIPANGTSMGKKRRLEKITLQLLKS
jgi:hypothetical protein